VVTRTDPFELLREVLETRFQRYTDRLLELTVDARRPGRGYDRRAVAALVAIRQSMADTAQALRRMADGTYGCCERCGTAIPLHRLEDLPHTRFCGSCERSGGGG
jgi:RNA polymerase-binding transcription factor DksA